MRAVASLGTVRRTNVLRRGLPPAHGEAKGDKTKPRDEEPLLPSSLASLTLARAKGLQERRLVRRERRVASPPGAFACRWWTDGRSIEDGGIQAAAAAARKASVCVCVYAGEGCGSVRWFCLRRAAGSQFAGRVYSCNPEQEAL